MAGVCAGMGWPNVRKNFRRSIFAGVLEINQQKLVCLRRGCWQFGLACVAGGCLARKE